jgi:hypothetical protein
MHRKAIRPGRVIMMVAFVALASWLLAASGAHKATAASTATYDGLSFRLQGCDLPVATVLPIAGKFICPDAAYTDGNLGKNWSELDLVPHRIIITAGNSAPATQTYTFRFAGDYFNSGRTGWDFIENGFENVSGGCTATIGPQQPPLNTNPAEIYRDITVTQAKNTVCQLDLYIRLSVGSHLFPGSSLHTNLLNDQGTTGGIGNKENSIPVNEIEPQTIAKDMAATRNSDHIWDLTKSATPASLDFGNVCDTGFSNTQGVGITVTWTKQPATPSGDATIITHVYATNPSHRTITVDVTDVVYEGTAQTVQVGTSSSGPVDVPANTASYPLLSHTYTTSSTASHFNDVATATYTDKVTGIPVPGTTTATAGADVGAGQELNASATVTDTESITGSGLTFAVASPSIGTFTGAPAYVAGTSTTGPVNWTSGLQPGSGNVTFNKTVTLDPTQVTSGTLTDTASLLGTNGFATSTAPLNVNIVSSATVSLTIHKTTQTAVDTAGGDTFNFDVLSGGNVVATTSITVPQGASAGDATLSGLAPGTYTIHETSSSNPNWNLAADQDVNIGVPQCSDTVNVANTFSAAKAQVAKVTDPAGTEAGWDMTLNGPGGPKTVTTTGTGFIGFGLDLQEGDYTITETAKAGWDQTGTSGTCSFTVDYPADAGKTFSCTFTNTQRGHIIVKKATDPSGASTSFTFNPSYGSSFNLTDGQQNDSGALVPDTYTVAEVNLPAGWTLKSANCDGGNTPGHITLGAGQTVTCTFTNQIRGHVRVVKAINNGPISGTQDFLFELRLGDQHTTSTAPLESGHATSGNAGTINFSTALVPGETYAICELLQVSYNPTIVGYGPYNPADNANYWCWNFSVTIDEAASNPSLTFNVENDHPMSKGLTIGYWKNWSSCKKSSGKQTDQLGKYLNGITLGTITFTTNGTYWECQAIQTLSKNTFTGINKSSDPLFNMAAQLLAADLNVNAQAGVCALAVDAMNKAQALLVKYGWNGNTYNGPLSAQDAADANFYASQLDKYNNNQLC